MSRNSDVRIQAVESGLEVNDCVREALLYSKSNTSVKSMICCLNPDCQSPQNRDYRKFCQSCRTPLITLVGNRYRPIRVLSNEGGFGRTYLAQDQDKLNELCVIKQLAPQVQGKQALNQTRQLFQQEAKRWQELGQHPQIPTLEAYFQEGKYLYLVQEFIDGQNLWTELQQGRVWHEHQVRELLLSLLPVLQFMHQRQVLHGDIKPQNIMRRRDGQWMLIDFNPAKQLMGNLVGKRDTWISFSGYSPLEQLQNGEACPGSDLFSLGATCFQLLSGMNPWYLWQMQGNGWVSGWYQYLRNPISPEFRRILDKLLPVEAQPRYESVGDVFKDLNHQKSQVKPIIVSQLGKGDCQSIGEAIKKAEIGTQILVQPGVYQEGLVIDKWLEIIGDGSVADIVIESTDSECIRMETAYAVVRGLTLRNQAEGKGNKYLAVDIPQGQLILEDCDITSDSLSCVGIHNANANPIIRRCQIHNAKEGGVFVWDNGQGIVEDCDIFDNGTCGVTIQTGSNPLIRRCQIHNDQHGGVLIKDNGQGILEDCDIFGNVFSGLDITTGGNPVIRRCQIHDGKTSGIFVYDHGQGTVEDCDIFGNGLSGVEIKTGGNPVIQRCQIHEGKQTGVLVWEKGQGTVEDCDIFGNTFSGVEIRTGGNPVIRWCGIHDGKEVGIFVQDNGQGTVEDCDIFGNAFSGVEIITGGNPLIRRCQINENGYNAVYVYKNGKGRVENCDLTGNGGEAWKIGFFAKVRRSDNQE